MKKKTRIGFRMEAVDNEDAAPTWASAFAIGPAISARWLGGGLASRWIRRALLIAGLGRQAYRPDWQKVFSLPDCLESRRFQGWVRGLDGASQRRVLDEIVDWELARQGITEDVRRLIDETTVQQDMFLAEFDEEALDLLDGEGQSAPKVLRQAEQIARGKAGRFRIGLLLAVAGLVIVGTIAGIMLIATGSGGANSVAAISAAAAEGNALASGTNVVTVQGSFTGHTVVTGESAASIAQDAGVTVQAVLWSNPNLWQHPSTLRPGEQILVPGQEGFVYALKSGDTLQAIGLRFNVDLGRILATNDIGDPKFVQPQQLVLLPCSQLASFSDGGSPTCESQSQDLAQQEGVRVVATN